MASVLRGQMLRFSSVAKIELFLLTAEKSAIFVCQSTFYGAILTHAYIFTRDIRVQLREPVYSLCIERRGFRTLVRFISYCKQQRVAGIFRA